MPTKRQKQALILAGENPNGVALPWKEDPIIMKRLEFVAQTMTSHMASSVALRAVNNAMSQAFPEVDPIGIRDYGRDRARVRQLWAEDTRTPIEDAKDEILAELNAVIRKADKAFSEADSRSLNRSAYLNTQLTAIRSKALVMGLIKNQTAAVLPMVGFAELADLMREANTSPKTVIDMVDAVEHPRADSQGNS